MPYSSINDLPDNVSDNLPKHAQEIYKSAFNSAHDEYGDASNTGERSHKVAWSAVKQQYEKGNDGNWHKK